MASLLLTFSFDLPYTERGEYPVGVREIRVDDEKGEAIEVGVWYPAENPDGLKEQVILREGLFPVEGRALRDAPVADGSYPLVVFSHGSGASRWLSLFYTEHLASHGFIVVAPVHRGNTILDTLDEDTFKETIIPSFVTRPQDVIRTIDYIATVDWLDGIVDMERIAISGHSFGGYTALASVGGQWDVPGFESWCDENADGNLDPNPDEVLTGHNTSEVAYGACFLLDYTDELPETSYEIGAVITFAPWHGPIWGDVGLENIDMPALTMIGTGDGVTPPERDAYRIYEQLGGTLIILEDADHFVYVDECSPLFERLGLEWSCSDAVWEMADAHDVIKHYSTAFLLNVFYDEGEPLPAEITVAPNP